MSERFPPDQVPREELPVSTTHDQRPSTTVTTSTSSPLPSVALIAFGLDSHFDRPAAYVPPGSAPTTASSIAPAPPSLPAVISAAAAAPTAAQVQQGAASASSVQAALPASSGVHSASSRGGRRSKTHVASACINCKRAHLSCDVNRPCARCVASGKQDTCFDVQHKKRGRPRLREEGELRKVEPAIVQAGSSSSMTMVALDPVARPTAAAGHRRQQSFRSLRSQGDDSSNIESSPAYPYPPPPTASQPTFGFDYPAPPSGVPDYPVPTAYLDMDLTIIKANPPWRQIMLGGQKVAGRQLSDIAAPADGQSFYDIRNRLRSERDVREPSYMPPINQPGSDPLQGVLETDVERHTYGFDDNTYTWTQTRIGTAAAQVFPARVRLAKASAYFVTVTLPSFRPAEIPALQAPPGPLIPIPQWSLLQRPQTRTPDIYGSPIRPATHSGLPSFPGTPQALLPAPLRSVGQQPSARAYPLVQQQQEEQKEQQEQQQEQNSPYQAPPPSVPRLSVTEPPTETTAFRTPRSGMRGPPQPRTSPSGSQLPPMVTSPPQRPRAAAVGPDESLGLDITAQVQTEDTDDNGTPRKRRRLDLDEVLHQ